MLSVIGPLILLSTASIVIVESSRIYLPPNTVHNITFNTTNPNLNWKRDTDTVLTLRYDNDTDGCLFHPQNPEYRGYCINNGKTYVLEILNTSLYQNSVFTEDQKICLYTTPEVTEQSISSNTLKEDKPIKINFVLLCEQDPSIMLELTLQGVSKELLRTNTRTCDNTLTNYTYSYTINSTTVIGLYNDVEWTKEVKNIKLTAFYYYVGIEDFSELLSTTFTFEPKGSKVPICCCCCCYSLEVLITTAVVVVVCVILVILHFCRREAKKEGNVYWVINVGFLLCGIVCLVLDIIQILYLEGVIVCPCLECSCLNCSCSDCSCSDNSGHNAAIAFVVLGFIANAVCIILFVIRLKQRDQSNETNTNGTEMKPNVGKETNGTSNQK